MIDYEFVEGRAAFHVKVFVDGKLSGAIRVVEGGFIYFPKGSRQHGDIFRTVREVQRSLEGDDDDQIAPPATTERG